MDLSVIVPIYNVAEYVEECLDSLAIQTGLEFEVILVDDGSTDNSGAIAEQYARTHENFHCYHKENGGLSDARNYGIERACGDYLAFVDSDDVVEPGIYATMLHAAQRNQSELVTCNVARFTSKRTWPSSLHKRMFSIAPSVTNIRECPQLVYDTTSWNKLYLRSFFLESGLKFPKGLLYEDIPVTIGLYCLAKSVSVLPTVGYYWRVREGMHKSITQQNDALRNLNDRLTVMRMLDDFIIATDQPEHVKRMWQTKALDIDLMVFMHQIPDLDEETADEFMQLMSDYISERINLECVEDLPVRTKSVFTCLTQGDKGEIPGLIGSYDRFHTAPVVEENDKLIALLPPDLLEGKRADVTSETIRIDINCTLSNSSIRANFIELIGAVYWPRVNMPEGAQRFDAYLMHDQTGTKLPLQIEPRNLAWMDDSIGAVLDVSTNETTRYDCSGFGFCATLRKKAIAKNPLPDGVWHVFIEYENRFGSGRVVLANPRGLATRREDSAALIGRHHIQLAYSQANEVQLIVSQANVIVDSVEHLEDAIELTVIGDKRTLALIPNGEDALSSQANNAMPKNAVILRKTEDGTYLCTPAELRPNQEYLLCSQRKDGLLEPVARSKRQMDIYELGNDALTLRSLQTWFVRCTRHDAPVSVMGNVEAGNDEIIIQTSLKGKAPSNISKAQLCYFDNLVSEYRILAEGVANDGDANEFTFLVDFSDDALTENLYKAQHKLSVHYFTEEGLEEHITPLYYDKSFNHRFEYDTLGVQIVRNSEGLMELRSLRRWPEGLKSTAERIEVRTRVFEEAQLEPLNEHMILFESMWGKKFSCNPRALYEYIDEHFPQFECVWSLIDERTPITGRARRVRKGSPEYFHCLATTKYLVNNVNFPLEYRKREGQIEIQTMHGTPLKTLGLEVTGEFTTKAEIEEYLEKTSRYDYLIVQGQFMEAKAPSVFAFDKDILRTGYPRTDRLFNPPRSEVRAIREKIGIPAGKKVLLYAPTWRTQGHFDMRLDLDDFKVHYGNSWVLLVKTHHLAQGSYRVPADNVTVFDCSLYDPIEDLYIASDALLTDYSSALFDYALTKKPMLFFTYDLEEYRDYIRGMYVDFEQEAPGPLLRTHEEVMDAIGRINSINSDYRARIERFSEKYLTYESPHSCEDVVEQVFGVSRQSRLKTFARRAAAGFHR